ncbi:hypothetical protein AYI68_g906 [Smittium mucronatum]|uniref:Uncharacterized protein n=1 Tax=Smittium mucronatum TaxID=133383 RepID=A0A1R0H755_9FUNG|nr:hypothetical protein AYI68_g906 [Smittium mucronatum]
MTAIPEEYHLETGGTGRLAQLTHSLVDNSSFRKSDGSQHITAICRKAMSINPTFGSSVASMNYCSLTKCLFLTACNLSHTPTRSNARGGLSVGRLHPFSVGTQHMVRKRSLF